jgi:hypothetical protein
VSDDIETPISSGCLHVYPQLEQHQPVIVAGTRDQLRELRLAIDRALDSNQPEACEPMTADGESYTLVVMPRSDMASDRLPYARMTWESGAVPYPATEDWARMSDGRALGHMAAIQEIGNKRPESGPMRFSGDWAGVFLRGDYACPMGMYLTQLLDDIRAGRKPSGITMCIVHGLADTLSGCDERGSLNGLRQMRPYEECVAPEQPPKEGA